MKELKCLFLIFCCFLVGIFGYHFPEQDMDVPQIIDYYGYTCETIYAETEDGYYLTLHRIPFGKNDTDKDASKPRPVVFLQHGLLGSSADWTTNIPSQSAAYVFADSGFDVWIGNVRGNVYSLKHRKYSHFQPAFWNFSFDDMATIDIPTMVKKALSVSDQKSLYFVGHSQGTAVMFAQGSEDQEFAKNISAFFALAPVSTVAHIRGLMSYIGSHFVSHMGRLIQLFGAYEFLPENIFSKFFAFLICGMGFTNPLCNNILFQIGGPDSKDINMTRVMIYMDHTPAGTSTKNIVHWAQQTQSGKFCKYDYGSQNMKFYGQKTPPEYDISQLKIPTYLYYSVDDWLADPLDVEGYIMAKLPNSTLKEANHLGIYNHMDYIWGMHAAEKIYHPIIDRIRKMESIKSNRVF